MSIIWFERELKSYIWCITPSNNCATGTKLGCFSWPSHWSTVFRHFEWLINLMKIWKSSMPFLTRHKRWSNLYTRIYETVSQILHLNWIWRSKWTIHQNHKVWFLYFVTNNTIVYIPNNYVLKCHQKKNTIESKW